MRVVISSGSGLFTHHQTARIRIEGDFLVVGRNVFDRTQVAIFEDESPLRLHLELRTGEVTKHKIVHFEDVEDTGELYTSVSDWLYGPAESEDQSYQRHRGGDDGEGWELSSEHEEEHLSRTVTRTLAYVLGRVARSPVMFTIFFISILSVGFGMVRDVAAEVNVRAGGTWHEASCTVEGFIFTARSVEVRTYENARMKNGTRSSMWRVTGAYNVTVRFDDGCDSDPRNLPNETEEEENTSEEYARGFFVIDVEERAEADEEAKYLPPPPAPSLPPRGPPPTSPPLPSSWPTDRGTVVVFNASFSQLPGNSLSTTSPPPPPLATPPSLPGSPDAYCTYEERTRELLRGEHIAYERLIMQHEDRCYGPMGSTQPLALAHCEKTWRAWFRSVCHVGERAPCWVFTRSYDHGGTAVYVVLSRGVGMTIWLYISYWVMIAVALVWLVYLWVRRLAKRGAAWCTQRMERESRGEEDAGTAGIDDDTADMFHLDGGVGLPGSEQARLTEDFYMDSNEDGEEERRIFHAAVTRGDPHSLEKKRRRSLSAIWSSASVRMGRRKSAVWGNDSAAKPSRVSRAYNVPPFTTHARGSPRTRPDEPSQTGPEPLRSAMRSGSRGAAQARTQQASQQQCAGARETGGAAPPLATRRPSGASSTGGTKRVTILPLL
mmetsp:Transcript_16478/g.50598  ORF Transcript_16478/g.50598 Transcript_16478/m.50598 type:complete len:662 (+) Transcript_16478:71-2056(+)